MRGRAWLQSWLASLLSRKEIGGIGEVRIVAQKRRLPPVSSPCGEQMNQFITEGLKDAGLWRGGPVVIIEGEWPVWCRWRR